MTGRRAGRLIGALTTVVAFATLAAACDTAPDHEAAKKAERSPVVQAACAKRLDTSTSGTLQSPEISEASGLAVSRKNRGTLWINNDSGDTARVFAVAVTWARAASVVAAGSATVSVCATRGLASATEAVTASTRPRTNARSTRYQIARHVPPGTL